MAQAQFTPRSHLAGTDHWLIRNRQMQFPPHRSLGYLAPTCWLNPTCWLDVPCESAQFVRAPLVAKEAV